MKFYVLPLVDWLPNAVRQTNQPKHIKPFFYFAFVLMLLRYCFAYRNRKRRDVIIILKTVKFNFLMLTDTVVSRQTADVTLGGILQLCD
jgi:hypothetical protein